MAVVAVVAAVLVGAVIQRSIGFGINLIVVPVLVFAAVAAIGVLVDALI